MTDDRPTSERFSLTLIPVAQQALAKIMKATGLTRADSINRAVQVYGFIAEEMHGGKELLLRDSAGNLERVHIV
ncbi:M20 family metallopeptidase [Kitasatospora acidiphila]|uniref:M20 family metallopeptidase n=1 Tax=Kitasatospora acidiphila TaxID=2567942 RepID=A0A540VYZ5_9ACTN|nr:M20 family metallopeptidase [Kitasatospora acidiphila]TQF01992.1 M20 family metallopeptidase [Kitasatospora acidiphila]